MKKTELIRKTPLKSSGALKRTTALVSSPKARSRLHAESAARRLVPKRRTATGRRDAGPSAKVRALLAARSGGWCEWPGCTLIAVDPHHRLNRKNGGRHGEMRTRINQAAWLLHACRPHHEAVTSPVGAARDLARDMGWLLYEGEDARQIPVKSRHGLVWLADDGAALTFPPLLPEEG